MFSYIDPTVRERLIAQGKLIVVVDVAVQGLISLLEPMLVVVLGTVIGTIVLALFLPLVKMIESVSGGV